MPLTGPDKLLVITKGEPLFAIGIYHHIKCVPRDSFSVFGSKLKQFINVGPAFITQGKTNHFGLVPEHQA